MRQTVDGAMRMVARTSKAINITLVKFRKRRVREDGRPKAEGGRENQEVLGTTLHLGTGNSGRESGELPVCHRVVRSK